MIDQISAFWFIFIVSIAVSAVIFIMLRRRRVFVSDRACIYMGVAVSIYLLNFLPVLTEGELVSYDDGRKIGSLDILGFTILASLVLFWVAVLSERSLKKKLDKQKK